ncbi:MAG: pyridoxamine 5'-phosphate oxidase family protein [Candidatus Bathyarchaeota archaeon]|nr:pyridoxamine 5'-phosphate oxidase family protein [Candidatus Bathyarchaeota archaeon]
MVSAKLPKMSKSEIDQLLAEQFLGRIAFSTRQAPHVAPFQYAVVDGTLYFHFTDYGKKRQLLDLDVPVCVEVEKYAPDLSTYGFVALTGNLQIVTDPDEKAKAASKMVETAQNRNISQNFLLAHGFAPQTGWSTLKTVESLVIVKLVNLYGVRGLKSS